MQRLFSVLPPASRIERLEKESTPMEGYFSTRKQLIRDLKKKKMRLLKAHKEKFGMASGGTIRKAKIKIPEKPYFVYATVQRELPQTVVTNKGIFPKEDIIKEFEFDSRIIMEKGGKTGNNPTEFEVLENGDAIPSQASTYKDRYGKSGIENVVDYKGEHYFVYTNDEGKPLYPDSPAVETGTYYRKLLLPSKEESSIGIKYNPTWKNWQYSVDGTIMGEYKNQREAIEDMRSEGLQKYIVN